MTLQLRRSYNIPLPSFQCVPTGHLNVRATSVHHCSSSSCTSTSRYSPSSKGPINPDHSSPYLTRTRSSTAISNIETNNHVRLSHLLPPCGNNLSPQLCPDLFALHRSPLQHRRFKTSQWRNQRQARRLRPHHAQRRSSRRANRQQRIGKRVRLRSSENSHTRNLLPC